MNRLLAALLLLTPAVRAAALDPWSGRLERLFKAVQERTPLQPSPRPAAPAPVETAGTAPVKNEFVALVKRVEKAVVQINLPHGLGSGFIVHPGGLIATNHHVAGPRLGAIVEVSLSNEGLGANVKIPGRVVALNRDKDLALVRIDPRTVPMEFRNEDGGMPVLALGDATRVEKGETVLALGSPHGFESTATQGIVSNPNRQYDGINPFATLVQTDAAINPGNSGGPLLNMRGEVIGINTLIFSRSGGSIGLGFAVSVEHLKLALRQFPRLGHIKTPKLGILFNPSGRAAPLGAYVEQVRAGSPAALAGVRAGDVILAADGFELPGAPGEEGPGLQQSQDPVMLLGRYIASAKMPKDTLLLFVLRGELALQIPVVLGE